MGHGVGLIYGDVKNVENIEQIEHYGNLQLMRVIQKVSYLVENTVIKNGLSLGPFNCQSVQGILVIPNEIEEFDRISIAPPGVVHVAVGYGNPLDMEWLPSSLETNCLPSDYMRIAQIGANGQFEIVKHPNMKCMLVPQHKIISTEPYTRVDLNFLLTHQSTAIRELASSLIN